MSDIFFQASNVHGIYSYELPQLSYECQDARSHLPQSGIDDMSIGDQIDSFSGPVFSRIPPCLRWYNTMHCTDPSE